MFLAAFVYLSTLITLAASVPVFTFKKVIFIRWWLLWLAITTFGYFSGNYWLFLVLSAIVIICVVPVNPYQKIVYYLVLLPVIPAGFGGEIPGMVPGIRYWFYLSYPRFLALLLLLPIAFYFGFRRSRSQRRYYPTDKYVALYLVYVCLMAFRLEGVTNILRAIFLYIIDIGLPYFVISRCVNHVRISNNMLLAIVFSGFTISMIAIFEQIKKWAIYESLARALHMPASGFEINLMRAGFLRVESSFEQPIALGFFLVCVLGAFLYLLPRFSRKRIFCFLNIMAISLALLFTISRGPWVGALVLFVMGSLFLKKSKKVRAVIAMLIFSPIFMLILLSSPLAQKVISLLPFIGQVDQDTVEYRQELIHKASMVIFQDPLFGSLNFLEHEELQSLEHGGLIDVVNTYIQQALRFGLVGVSLFSLISVMLSCQLFTKIRRHARDGPIGGYRLGILLLSLTVSMMVMLATASLIGFIPVYYWIIIAMGAGHCSEQKDSVRKLRLKS